MSFEEILSRIDLCGGEVVEVCSQLVKRPSAHPEGRTAECVEYIGSYFDDLGIPSEVHEMSEGKPNIVAHVGGGSDRTIMWVGHLDVVPVGKPENWTYPPYGGEVADGRVWGRGSSDMKGSDASAIVAARVLNEIEPPHNIDFWFTADEEIGGGAGARWLAEERIFQGEVAIIGDGGGCTPGQVNIGVGNKGGAGTRLVARGKTAHGSTPHLGDNAIDKLLRVIPYVRRIGEYRLELPPELEGIVKSSVELLLKDPGLSESQRRIVRRLYDYPSGPSLNVLNGGEKSNVVPDYAEAVFDIRLTPGCDPLKVKGRIEELVAEAAVPGVSVEVRASPTAGYYERVDSPAVTQFAEAVRAVTGEEPSLTIAPWGTDAVSIKRFMRTEEAPDGIPTLIFGPMVESQLHQQDEYVPVENLVTAAKVYACFPFFYA